MGRAESRQRRTGVIIAVAVGVVALAAIALLMVRPARVTGISQNALEASLGKALGSSLAPSCDKLRGERWSCVAAEEGSERDAYEVRVDDWGCWRAKRAARGSGGAPDTTHEACISVVDFIDIDTG